MSIALGDALLGWLVASAGEGLIRQTRGDHTQVALRMVVEEAVTATAAEVATDLDSNQAEHLRSSLLVRDIGPSGNQRPIGTEAELRDAVHAWTAALDEATFGGPGYLTGLGVNPRRLADALADRIVAGIHRNARGGGALEGLAGWLWRDEATARLARIEDKIDGAGRAESPGTGLPGGTPEFTGRQEMLDELARRVQAHDPDGIVVAIHAVDGMAGVGKTELALRAAHEHKHRYPDGQYFLDLHGYTDGIPPMRPASALEELLRQAGVPGAAVPNDLAARQARWRSLMADRRALVLLDNALDADQVRALLPGAAGSLVLITSRTRLRGLPGAKPLRLDVLPTAEAVELFIRLVGTARPLNSQAVATVVHRVGFLPVAVHAVAALVDDTYSEIDLADELTDAGTDTGPLDQTSPLGAGVWAALETSLRRLDPPHQRAFRLLGVHPGTTIGVPQFAALADLSIASARAMLRGLDERNLIIASASRVGHLRYQVHDLMRAFARRQAAVHLTEQEHAAAIDRLTTWYAAAMAVITHVREATGSDLSQAGVEGVDLDRHAAIHQWIAAEQENLLAYASVVTGEAAADVCCQTARNLYELDYHTTAQVLYDTAVILYRQAGCRAGEADARRGLGEVARATGKYSDAASHYRAAQRIFAEIGNRSREAYTRRGLGLVALATGDYPRATSHFHAAQRIFAEIGNRGGEAYARRGLGEIARLTGDYHGAAEHYHAAHTISSVIGKRSGEAYARRGLGFVTMSNRDYCGAAEHFHAARRIFAEIGNRSGEASTRWALGEVARATVDYSGAVAHYHAAQTISGEIGERAAEAEALVGLGHVAYAQGRCSEARKRWEDALRTIREIGAPSAASVRDLLTQLGQGE